MSKRIMLFTFFIFATIISFAQTKTVKGKVIDESGSAVKGVSVLQKGSTKGTQTDSEGDFSIDVPSGAKSLVFSSVGYTAVTEDISGKTSLTVVITKAVTTGDEVVVIGYQTVRRKDLTGSVSSVGAKQIKDIPVNSAAEALTGRLAGVNLSSTEGKPGAEVVIKVRGGNSITQETVPLFIVDGVQVENALSILSPQDIESVDVLKDASATAIYGARGSNGVIIITTKKGRNGKTIVSYNGFAGIRQLPNKLEVLKPYDFVRYQYERSRGNATDSSNFARDYGTTFDTLNVYKNTPFIDWQEIMFGRNANFQSHNISVTGGTAATQFSFGATSNTEEGILLNNSFDRKLFNFSLDQQATSKLKVGLTSRYNNTVINGAGTSQDGAGAATNRLRQAVKYRPLLIKGQAQDDYDATYAAETNTNSLSIVNPILYNQSEYRKDKTDVLNISVYANLKFTKWLSFKSTFGYDLTNRQQDAFDDSLSNNSKLNGASLPIAAIGTSKRVTFNNTNVLTYTNASNKSKFAKRNVISAIAGHEIYERNDQLQTIETRYFPQLTTPEVALANMNLASPPTGVSLIKPITFRVTSRVVSGFARFNYTRDNKYLLTLSARSDGSSKFSEDHKWSFFPSGSFAWKVSEEKFFGNLKSIVNEAKVRLSYGVSGNNRIGDYLYKQTYTVGQVIGTSPGTYGLSEQLVTAFTNPDLSNPNLIWEKTLSRNIGLDLSFLRSRISLSVDVYDNKSQDLLIGAPIPTSSGYSTQLQNVGSIQNKGAEFQLNTTPVSNKNFTWNANFNISFNKNTVKSIGQFTKSNLYSSGWAFNTTPADYILRPGDPLGSMWGYITDGFYKVEDFNYNTTTGVYTLKAGQPNNSGVTSVAPQPGTLKFKNITGDSVVNDADKAIIGNTNPKFFGGFNQQFTYKNFDASVFLNFTVGNDIYNANKLEFTSGYQANTNLLAIVNERWTNINAQGQIVTEPTALAELNKNAKIWSPSKQSNSYILHSWAVEDGSFLRINNVSIGYTIPESLTKRAKISKFRVYATVNNLHVFTNYSGYDPEVNARRRSQVTPGVDYSAYPRSRSYILGVNLSL